MPGAIRNRHIKLAPIAMAECNTLLAQFVKSLAREELMSGSGNAPAIAYAFIARNLLGRGFYKAARCSMLRSLESLGSTNLSTGVDALSMFLRGGPSFSSKGLMNRIDDLVRRIARKALPTRLRETIRVSLRRGRPCQSPSCTLRWIRFAIWSSRTSFRRFMQRTFSEGPILFQVLVRIFRRLKSYGTKYPNFARERRLLDAGRTVRRLVLDAQGRSRDRPIHRRRHRRCAHNKEPNRVWSQRR